MKLKIEVLERPDKDWDNRVAKGEGDIYQSIAYADFQENCLNMETHYIVVKKEDKIIGQVMINSGARFSKYLNGRNQLRKFFTRHFKIYTFIRSPIILDKEHKVEIYEVLLDYIEELAEKGYAIKDLSLPIKEDKEIHKLFYKRGFYSDDWGTVVINTTKPKDELWKNIKKSRRNIIRKGGKQGLTVRKIESKSDYKKAYLILKEMSARNNIFCHSWEYYEEFFDVFSFETKGGVFLVEQEGKPLATITLYEFNNKACQTAVGYSDICLTKKISATDFIEWFLISYCQSNGIESYDLAGIRPKSKDEKDINLLAYKKRWGGEEIHYPYFSKEYSWWKKMFVRFLIKTVKKKYQKKQQKESI